MDFYAIASADTRRAKRKLEELGNGKELLKKFLNTEKNKLTTKNTVNDILTHVIGQNNDSNIYKFAELLKNNENNMQKFRKAIEYQAKSLGTNKNGLFNKLIWQNGNLKMDNLDKSKIKAFLLAKSDPESAIEYYDEDVNLNDLDAHRMKNGSITEKLKSNRLSNILKVFMSLVLWSLIKQQKNTIKDNSQDNSDTASKMPAINIRSNLEIIEKLKREKTSKTSVEQPPLAVDDETFKKIINHEKGKVVYRGIVGPDPDHFKERYRNLMIKLGYKSSTKKQLETGERSYGEGVYWSTFAYEPVLTYGLKQLQQNIRQHPTTYTKEDSYCVIYMAFMLSAANIPHTKNATYFVMQDNLSFVLRKNFLDLSPYDSLKNVDKELGVTRFEYHCGDKIESIDVDTFINTTQSPLTDIPGDWWKAVGLEKHS